MSRVGENIKKARLEAKLTQKALGKKIGVSEAFINEVETGKKIINESIMDKISKVLGKELNDISMAVDDDKNETTEIRYEKPRVAQKNISAKEPVNDTWSGAFSSVLKSVPVYDYTFKKVFEERLLPIQNNKVEGFPQDKVFYVKIMDEDMLGFRIMKDDLAFGYMCSEIQNSGFYLLDFNGQRVVRQVKKLDNSKLLLISNKGTVKTETAGVKDVKPIAKFHRIEFNL